LVTELREGQGRSGRPRPRPVVERDTLGQVLELIRRNHAFTRQEIEQLSGLGRATVADRLTSLGQIGLVEEGALGASTGGRAPRHIRFRSSAGHVLVATVGTTTIGVGLTDLAGRLLVEHHEAGNISAGPAQTLDRVGTLFEWILAEHARGRPIWGIGLGMPGPIEHADGRFGAAARLRRTPGWDGVAVTDHFRERYEVPTWMDSEAHLSALGELRVGHGVGRRDLLYLKIGSEISVGVCADGRVLRGARGYAGEVGHVAASDQSKVICRCGNTGCLVALAGGAAIARDGALAAHRGESPYLARLLGPSGELSAADVGVGAARGDARSIEILSRAGGLIGASLATLVNAYNPSLVVVGGGVAQAGDVLLSAIRESVYRHSRSVAVQNIQIARSELGKAAGLVGAAVAVADELFAPDSFRSWVDYGSPVAAHRSGALMVSAA
jgi:predicted NBD/HSP70 family sugar kinase